MELQMKMIRSFGLTLMFLPIMTIQCHASVIAQSDWNNPLAGADGWSFVHDGSNMSLISTGGNGGGFLQITDLALGTTMYFVAPAKFLGNQSAAYTGSLTFDLQQSYDTNYYADDDVILTGNGITLAYFHGVNPAVSPGWSSISVPLVASAGWKVGSVLGAAATESQLQSVLSNLAVLWIRPEFQVGPDVDGIDNVTLQSGAKSAADTTPEPASLLMAAGGLAAIAIIRKRSIRNERGSI